MRILSILLVLVLASSAFSQAVFNQTDEANYTLGLQSFRQGDYSTAYQYFRQIMDDSLNQRSSESFYYGARSLFNLRRYQESSAVVDTFLNRFPADEHKFEMVYILGANYYELGNYSKAAAQFVTAVDSSGSQVVKDQAVASLHTLVAFNLSFDAIESLFEKCHSRLSSVTVAIGFARRAYFSDRLNDADRILTEFRERFPAAGVGSGEASRWLDRIAADSALSQAPVKIGALLPLEYGSGVGDRLLLGIQLALDNYNATAPVKVGLVLKNYSGAVQNLFSDMLSLAEDKSVRAVIGPVYSGEVSALAKLANQNKLPMISPTATQVGLTKGNPYVFQSNPDFKTRAVAMADYAVNVLHARRIAILAPSDTYGKTISEYFSQKLDSLGDTTVATAYFESGSTDLAEPIGEIKTAAAKSGEPYVDVGALNSQQQAKIKPFIPAAFVDSLGNSRLSIDAIDLFGRNAIQMADSLGIPLTVRDSLGVFDALRSLDAVFIPLTSAKDIGVIGAQLAYYNVRTQILGTDDWYDLNQLSNNALYVDGIIFCSDTYFNPNLPAFAAVTDSLAQISDVDFNRPVSYGYDLTNALLKAVKSGDTTRASLEDALKSQTYDGLHSTISFEDNNSNHYLHILQFKNGNVIDLGEVNAK
jgi:ABC-type branched-subunit amino acid transport system substrate-binding protein